MRFKERLRNERNEIYYRFLDDCRKKYEDLNLDLGNISTNLESQPLRIYWQKHHIVPKFIISDCLKQQNGALPTPLEVEEMLLFQEFPENLIILTEQDHIIAHQLLFDIYGDHRDEGAVHLLTGSSDAAKIAWRKAGAFATHAVLKAAGKNFWNSDYQKDQVRKALLRSDALVTRSVGGKLGGRTRQLNRAITAKDKYLFSYKGKPYLCIFNCSTGGDVVKELNRAIKTPIERISPILNGKRASSYGWSATRIEVVKVEGLDE